MNSILKKVTEAQKDTGDLVSVWNENSLLSKHDLAFGRQLQ